MIVVDSSVLVNAVVDSVHSEHIDQAFDLDPAWIAPDLWRSEVRSAMIKHIRHGTFSLFEGFERAEEAEGLVAETREIRDHHQVLTIAVKSGCSAYDSEFVALALETGLPLLTYDRKLIDAFPGIAMTPGDWLERTES